MILADTSAWVEFDRATGSPADRRLTRLVGHGRNLATTEPVMMEVLAGARDDVREGRLRRLLRRFELLQFDAAIDFEAAVRIYRLCRQAGITPRGLVDCMIASVAIRYGVKVLAHDADFARMSEVVAFDLDEASLRAP